MNYGNWKMKRCQVLEPPLTLTSKQIRIKVKCLYLLNLSHVWFYRILLVTPRYVYRVILQRRKTTLRELQWLVIFYKIIRLFSNSHLISYVNVNPDYWNTEHHKLIFIKIHTNFSRFQSTYLMCIQSLSCVRLFVALWTVAHQAPLSMEFSRQEYWSRSPFLLRESSQPSVWTQIPSVSRIGRCILYN